MLNSFFSLEIAFIHSDSKLLEIGMIVMATRPSARSFAHTAHLFACSALLASLAHSLAPGLMGKRGF